MTKASEMNSILHNYCNPCLVLPSTFCHSAALCYSRMGIWCRPSSAENATGTVIIYTIRRSAYSSPISLAAHFREANKIIFQ